jgi:hypothetical protein
MQENQAIANRSDTPAEVRLRESTEMLKAVFGRYERPRFEECMDGLDNPEDPQFRAAWAKGLWECKPQELEYFVRHYYCGYFPTQEDRERLSRTTRYWLPRFLHDISSGVDDIFLSERLVWAKWREWPKEEIDAVKSWFVAWLRACIAFDHAGDQSFYSRRSRSASTCLEYAIEMGLDLTFVLYDMAGNLSHQDVYAIQHIVTVYAPDIIRREKLDDDSNPEVAILRALLRWMLHPATNGRLERAFFRYTETDPKLARDISETSEWIENVRKSYFADPRGMPKWLHA